MYDRLKDMLHDELDRIQDNGDINETSLQHINLITHSLKSIATIEAMERSSHDRSDRYRDDYRGRDYRR